MAIAGLVYPQEDKYIGHCPFQSYDKWKTHKKYNLPELFWPNLTSSVQKSKYQSDQKHAIQENKKVGENKYICVNYISTESVLTLFCEVEIDTIIMLC